MDVGLCGHQLSVHEGLNGHFKTGVSRSEVPPALPRVAQRYARNANQLFQWRKKYREGRLGSRTTATKLLPVYHIDRHVEFRRSLGYSFKTQAAWNQSPKEAADDPCRAVTCTTAKSRMRS